MYFLLRLFREQARTRKKVPRWMLKRGRSGKDPSVKIVRKPKNAL
jgi:hypothetical protein